MAAPSASRPNASSPDGSHVHKRLGPTNVINETARSCLSRRAPVSRLISAMATTQARATVTRVSTPAGIRGEVFSGAVVITLSSGLPTLVGAAALSCDIAISLALALGPFAGH